MPPNKSKDKGEKLKTIRGVLQTSGTAMLYDSKPPKSAPPKAEISRKPPGANPPKTKPSSDKR